MNFIDPFVEFIKEQMDDPNFAIKIKTDWGSSHPEYRLKIRTFLAEVDSSYFTREQQAQLYDLNHRPTAQSGYISISHCLQAGGYSYSKSPLGFDIEEVKRISVPIITRTSSEDERSKSPHLKFLWVAKEAAFKALGESSLVITDISCKNWLQTTGLEIWSYQVRSDKDLRLDLNVGFVFSTPTLLLAVFLK